MKYNAALKGKGTTDPAKVSSYRPPRKELVFSLRDFDHTQGQTFSEWQEAKLLDTFLDKLREYCKKTLPEAQQARLTIYGSFPPESEFRPPAFIPRDAQWASLHIQGKECAAGHLIDNTFYIVFLDRNHEFWPSKLKHT
ncbi:hypothetical protein FACS1894124_5540 [Spirochaetia bacterium]|nr:hypothetical protein FACS1894124_5540 [Spirochaetia bacterium]